MYSNGVDFPLLGIQLLLLLLLRSEGIKTVEQTLLSPVLNKGLGQLMH